MVLVAIQDLPSQSSPSKSFVVPRSGNLAGISNKVHPQQHKIAQGSEQ